MGTPDSLIRTVRRQLRWTLTLRTALQFITLYLFAWGVVVVAARAVAPVDRDWLGWGAIGVAVAAIAAVVVARRKVPDEAAIRALCDRQQQCGGLVMSEGEIGLGPWLSRRKLAPLRIRWRSGRQWALLAAALAFVVLGFVVPDRPAAQQQTRENVRFADNIADLEEQIDLLAEEAALEPEQADDYRKTLEEIDDTARDDAMRAWEMLDHLEDQLSQSAEEAAEQAVTDTADLAEAAALADALAEDQMSEAPKLDAHAASEALDNLADMLSEMDPKLAEAWKDLDLDADAMRDLADRLREQAEQGEQADASKKQGEPSLDEQSLESLCELAGICKGQGDGKTGQVQRLVEARMIDPKWAAECEAAGEADGQSLLAMLTNTPAGGPSEDDAMPSAMTFAENAIGTDDVSFEPQALPPGGIDRDQSTTIGLSSSAPQEDLPEQRSNVSALRGAAAGGGSANSQQILPRHRGAVERYFERE